MGLLDRLMGRRAPVTPAPVSARAGQSVSAVLLGGHDDLEVVGESFHQDVLWQLCSGTVGERVRFGIIAVLVPEPANPYDPNAIAVQVDGEVVGHLSRATAQEYLPGLKRLMSAHGGFIALQGVIVGGGYYDDGPGRLGVWLGHDPVDFDVRPTPASRAASRGQQATDGTMRTGLTEAWLTDAEDDSYDLSWYNELPEGDRPAIAKLRQLLAADRDPIDRHFQFAELEARLYRSRDLYESALTDYDDACIQHDAEMEAICVAFMAKWGKIPLLETYRQMAIRQAKKKDWAACRWWAERGLALYDRSAAREEAVEDLTKRRNRAIAKLETAAAPMRRVSPGAPLQVAAPTPPPQRTPSAARPDFELEVLVCHECGSSFERMRVRGRKPLLCPQCRTTTSS